MGELAVAERTIGDKDTKKYQSQVVLTVQDNLNLLGAGLLVLPQGTEVFLDTLISFLRGLKAEMKEMLVPVMALIYQNVTTFAIESS